MTSVALAHLYALRAHVDAVILLIEQEAGAGITQEPEPGSCPTCGAPPDQVVDASMLDGTIRKRCEQCAAVWEL